MSIDGTILAISLGKMSNSKNRNKCSAWIIKLPGGAYLKHPSGQLTQNKTEAYAWYYKKDAQGAIRKDPDVRLLIHQRARENPNDVAVVEKR